MAPPYLSPKSVIDGMEDESQQTGRRDRRPAGQPIQNTMIH
jgi:hypothetical protein